MGQSVNKISFACLLFFSSVGLKAQDAAFSQFQSSLLYLNPAFAGEERDMEISANYRTQWKTVAVPYQTSQLSFILPLYNGPAKQNHFGGLGLSLYTDKAGTGELKTIGASVSLGKLVQLTSDRKNTLSLGVQIGGAQRSINLDKLQWGEQYQPFLGYSSAIIPQEYTSDMLSRRFILDMAAGAVYYYNDINEYDNGEFSAYFGLSAYHLNEANESFTNSNESKLPRIFKGHAGVDVPLSSYFYLSPNVLTMYQGNYLHVNGGMNLIYNLHNNASNMLLSNLRLSAGVGARVNDALIYNVSIGNKVFTLGFSYDMTTNGLSNYRTGVGATEVSLIIRNPIDHIFNKVDTPRI